MATAKEIAGWLGAELSGEDRAEQELIRVAAAETADQSAIIFASDRKTLKRAEQSAAGLILASSSLIGEAPIDPRIIWVEDARYAFAMVATRLKEEPRQTRIHRTAILHAEVQIGDGTEVGPGCVIGQRVVLGRECNIGPNVTIYEDTTLGDRVAVQAGAVLGARGFGYVRHRETGRYLLFPQQGRLVIEDDVEIGANTTIDRGALGETRIGAGSKLDNLVHVGHNCLIGKNVIVAAQTGISGSSVIEDGAILGGQVGIGEHALVGQGVILGGGAGVLSGKKMHGRGEVFWGRPARPLREYLKDLARLKRR